MPDCSAFQLEGYKVLEYARHNRKLHLGALKGNAFTLVLREISDRRNVEIRLQAIRDGGVLNYFGVQRFGIGGSNLQGGAVRKVTRQCAIAINAVFGCRRHVARCLIKLFTSG